MRAPRVLLACIALAACGCGDDANGSDGSDGGAAAPRSAGADLTVTVRPKGKDGPARTRRIRCERLGEGSRRCRRLRGLTARSLAPVPDDVACTEIYGGPATARVRGVLRGRRVDARFDRSNGCEIERWDRNRALLGPAPVDLTP
jgi:hypothetical protein